MNTENSNIQHLLAAVEELPDDWAFVVVGHKKNPLGVGWQNTRLCKQDLQLAAETSSLQHIIVVKENHTVPFEAWKAIGVLCGVPSGGLLFVDHDGASCDQLIEKRSGLPIEQAMPKTLRVTSGKRGRYQAIYHVPQHLWESFKTKRLKTEQVGGDGKPEQLELRWNGCQSVIIGHHPDTGSYKWLPGCSPAECEIADVPTWIVDLMQDSFPMLSHQTNQGECQHWNDRVHNSDDVERALSFLNVIPSTEDYDFWIKVGMALHSVDTSLLSAWEFWSQGATNYVPGACGEHWKSFNQDKGIGIGTLGKLAKQHGWQSPVKQILQSAGVPGSATDQNQLLSECFEEQEEEREELKQEVQNLVQLAEEPAPLYSLLSPSLIQPFEHLAMRFNAPLEAFVGILLAVCASLLRVGTLVEIDPDTNFYPPPILWVGLLGEPGSLKSPILTAIVKPLHALQRAADEQYKIECEKHDELIEEQRRSKEHRDRSVTEPVPREYFVDDMTFEALASCLSKQPNQGTLISVDELAGFFNSFNRYSKGQGGDRQKCLSLYNGNPLKVNRKKGDRISLDSTSVSLIGGIQPDVFHQYAPRLNDADGLWSRFCWIRLPVTEMPPPSQGQHCNLAAVLKSLYTGLDALPAKTYRLDPCGQKIWHDWHCWTEKQKIREYSPAMRVLYPKARERAARIALVAHCVNAVAEGRRPEDIISSEVLEAAISFTKWLIGQTKLIYTDLGATDHPLSSLIIRLMQRSKSKKDDPWIHPRDVTHCFSSKKKPKCGEARALMRQIVDLGYAIDNGKTDLRYAIQFCRNVEEIGNKSPK